VGRQMTAETVEAAAAAAAGAAAPISDVRSTAAYRREMVRILVKDALTTAALPGKAEGRAS